MANNKVDRKFVAVENDTSKCVLLHYPATIVFCRSPNINRTVGWVGSGFYHWYTGLSVESKVFTAFLLHV